MNKKGFTLIELLVVVAIISMLTSVTLSSLSDAKQKGRDTGKIRALQEVRKALQLYVTEKGYYPSNDNTSARLASELAPYISSLPSGIKYTGTFFDGTACVYSTYTSCPSYHLGIPLERTDNKVLLSDADTITTGTWPQLYGNKDTCVSSGGTSVPDLCYDIVP